MACRRMRQHLLPRDDVLRHREPQLPPPKRDGEESVAVTNPWTSKPDLPDNAKHGGFLETDGIKDAAALDELVSRDYLPQRTSRWNKSDPYLPEMDRTAFPGSLMAKMILRTDAIPVLNKLLKEMIRSTPQLRIRVRGRGGAARRPRPTSLAGGTWQRRSPSE